MSSHSPIIQPKSLPPFISPEKEQFVILDGPEIAHSPINPPAIHSLQFMLPDIEQLSIVEFLRIETSPPDLLAASIFALFNITFLIVAPDA